MIIVECDVPPGTLKSEFNPFPGSYVGLQQGCTCPEFQPWPGNVRFDADCPVHQLAKVPQ